MYPRKDMGHFFWELSFYSFCLNNMDYLVCLSMWTSTGTSLSKLQSKTKNRPKFVALIFLNLKHDTHNPKVSEIVPSM